MHEDNKVLRKFLINMTIYKQKQLINMNKGKFNLNLLPYCHSVLMPFDEILSFVTNSPKNRQLSFLTCFIIHVGLECIGDKTYA